MLSESPYATYATDMLILHFYTDVVFISHEFLLQITPMCDLECLAKSSKAGLLKDGFHTLLMNGLVENITPFTSALPTVSGMYLVVARHLSSLSKPEPPSSLSAKVKAMCLVLLFLTQ